MNRAIRMFAILGAAFAASTLPAAPIQGKPRIEAAYCSLPLSFERNTGQADAATRYLSHGAGYSLALTATGAELRLPDGTVRMKLAGSGPAPEVSGIEELPGKVNYFLGNDPGEWRTNVPTYAKVKYRDVYPGVDLVFYGKGKRLEYDFIVAPGVDPEIIQLAFEGADSLDMDSAGELRLRMRKSEIRLRKPVVYQTTAAGRRALRGEYALNADHVAFRVDSYDPSMPLVIDPVLDYASYLGGSGAESANAIALDAQGNAYIAGFATSPTGFPILNPLPDSAGWWGAFVSKLNPEGSALVYSTYLGGRDSRGSTSANGIAVDGAGNVYVTGTTWASDFPMRNPIQRSFSGNSDLFVTKLNATGSAIVYSTYLGGAGYDYGNAIAVDALGNAHVAGAIDRNPQGGYVSSDRSNAFVAKLNPAGSAMVYSVDLGGSLWDQATGITVDTQGNAYVTGSTNSPNFPTLNAVQPFPSVASAYRSRDGGKTWDRSDSGLATSVFVIVIDPGTPSTIYAAGERGIFKSTDGGDSWRGINSGISSLNLLVSGLTIDPNSPSTLYAVTSGGGLLDPPGALYKSVNGGDSWREVSLVDSLVGIRPVTVLVDPSNSAVLYTGTNQGVLKSTDGGASWHSLVSTGFVTQMAIDRRNPSTLYARQYAPNAPTSGLIKTVDGGETWAPLDNAPDNVYGIATDPMNSGVLYASADAGMWKSSDRGANWRKVLAAAALPIFGAGSLYVPTSDGILASDDGGESWKPAGFSLPIGTRNLVADSSRPGRFFVGGGGDYDAFLAKLNPAGRVVYSTYLGGIGGDTGMAVAVDSQGAAYVTGSTASSDFLGVQSPQAPGANRLEAFVVKVSPAGSEVVYARYLGGAGNDVGKAIAVDSAGAAYVAGSTDSMNFPIASAVQRSLSGGSMIKSSDGGAHWSPSGEGLASSEIRVLAADRKSATVYAAGAGGVSVSLDGGSSWKTAGLPEKVIGILLIDPHTPTILYAAGGRGWGPGSSGVFQTTDGGVTWREISNGLTSLVVRALAIDPAEPSTLYAGTAEGIFKTTDSGRNWNRVNDRARPVYALAVDPTDSSVLYALGGPTTSTGYYYAPQAAVYRSSDAGATWTAGSPTLQYPTNILIVDPSTPSTLYYLAASDSEDSYNQIFKSVDYGGSWNPVGATYELCGVYALALDPETGSTLHAGGARIGGSCLIRSADGGQSWQMAESQIGLGVAALEASSGTLYASVKPGTDAFAAKLNADGSLVYSTYLGGGRMDWANAIAVGSSGDAWVAGTTTSADFPVMGPFQGSFGGTSSQYAGGDAFVVRLAGQESPIR